MNLLFLMKEFLCCDACVCELSSFSHIQLCVTLWMVSHQAPLSVGFSRQEYGVRCYSLLQGIFPTQESNLRLPHCRKFFTTEPPGKICLSKFVLLNVSGFCFHPHLSYCPITLPPLDSPVLYNTWAY